MMDVSLLTRTLRRWLTDYSLSLIGGYVLRFIRRRAALYISPISRPLAQLMGYTWRPAPPHSTSTLTTTAIACSKNGMVSILEAAAGAHTLRLSVTTGGTTILTIQMRASGAAANTSPPPPPPPTVLLLDDFVDVNGTPLSSHTMNTGPGWSVLSGTWTIESNAAVQSSVDTTFDDAVSNAGVASGSITLVFSPPSASGWVSGVALRFSSVGNGWHVYAANYLGNHVLNIESFIAGVRTPVASGAIPATLGGSHTITVAVSGTTITAMFDGADTVSFNAAAFNATATNFGIGDYEDTNASSSSYTFLGMVS